jgi:DNA-binding winged helix-turn-helix (wHTH) protein
MARKYEWFVRYLLRQKSMKGLAKEAGITQPAVTQAIADFRRWLPGDLRLAFPRPTVRAEIEAALGLQQEMHDARRMQDDLRRIQWLARWAMGIDDIARLVGYRPQRVAEILEATPAKRPGPRTPLVCVDSLVVDRRRREVTRDGRRVSLSEREYALLDCFAREPGQIVRAAELATSIWRRDDELATGLVRVYVGHLRQKLGGGSIHTVRGAGYRFGPSKGKDPSDLERERLLRVLTETDQTVSLAAARLGLPRSTLHYRLRRHGLARTAHRQVLAHRSEQ